MTSSSPKYLYKINLSQSSLSFLRRVIKKTSLLYLEIFYQMQYVLINFYKFRITDDSPHLKYAE